MRLIGLRKAMMSAWNAMSMPMLRRPSITRRPPTPIVTAVLSAMSSGGTTPSTVVVSCSCWYALLTLAWWPAQRLKKSDSAPVALSVSIV